jgi:hypothetical protein
MAFVEFFFARSYGMYTGSWKGGMLKGDEARYRNIIDYVIAE